MSVLPPRKQTAPLIVRLLGDFNVPPRGRYCYGDRLLILGLAAKTSQQRRRSERNRCVL